MSTQANFADYQKEMNIYIFDGLISGGAREMKSRIHVTLSSISNMAMAGGFDDKEVKVKIFDDGNNNPSFNNFVDEMYVEIFDAMLTGGTKKMKKMCSAAMDKTCDIMCTGGFNKEIKNGMILKR